MKTELEAGEAAAVALFVVVVVVHVVLTAAAVAVGILIRVTARRLLVFPIHHHGRRRGGSFDLRKEESISLIISSVSPFSECSTKIQGLSRRLQLRECTATIAGQV